MLDLVHHARKVRKLHMDFGTEVIILRNTCEDILQKYTAPKNIQHLMNRQALQDQDKTWMHALESSLGQYAVQIIKHNMQEMNALTTEILEMYPKDMVNDVTVS